MNDLGAKRLLAAIYLQAQEDLEDFYGRVRLKQRACEKGRPHELKHTLDDFTAVLWNDEPRRSTEIKEMVTTCKQYFRYCRNCERGVENVQREGA